MGKGARNRAIRASEAASAPPAELAWADVDAALDITPTDIDYIIAPERFNDESDDGAPASVYSDLSLLRAWLTLHHPLAVCDGDDCMKRHYPTEICGGSALRANMTNRARGALVQRLRAEDGKATITPATVLAFLEREGQQHDQRTEDQ